MMSMSSICAASLLLLGGAFASTIDPAHSTTLTMYHINPLSAGVVPKDEDTGDLDGILYFFLDTLFLPLECADPNASFIKQLDCTNPERLSPDMVHTYVEMEVDDRLTGYSLCNLCVNGTDPISHTPCTIGEYQCNCGLFPGQYQCDRERMGVETIPGASGRRRRKICNEGYACQKVNLPKKTQGKWYSPTKEGYCDEYQGNGTCGWRIQNMFTVNDTCVRESIYTTVESANTGCFGTCGTEMRNVSSACWIDCFFGAILGPEARNSTSANLALGMAMEDVEAGYLNAFKPEVEGGCPRIQIEEENGLFIV